MTAFYFCKRTRSESLGCVSYLTTKVLKPTFNDWLKLKMLVGYLESTIDDWMVIEPKGLWIECYVDASFNVHPNGKSHSGCIITLGGAPCYSHSGAQRLVTTSSCESEMVALGDNAHMLVYFKQFMQMQGYRDIKMHCWEDNRSSIDLWTKGYSTSKTTKHIALRYFFVTDLMERDIMTVTHLKSALQLADALTKGVTRTIFDELKEKIFNSWSELHSQAKSPNSATLTHHMVMNIDDLIDYADQNIAWLN